MRVLVTETLSQEGRDLLSEHAEVDVKLGLDEEALCRIIGDYDALVVRSSTQVNARIVEAGRRLQVIGRAGTGVDNIDVEAATRRGVMVVNAPTGNTVAVAEHAIALILALARNVARADCSLKEGRWDKKKLEGVEIRGKTLGIIGLGRAGSAVAKRAGGLEMRILAYDPFVTRDYASRVGVGLVSLEELLTQSDFISLHAPVTEQTHGMISDREFSLMKPSVRIINCARGGLIDEEALLRALQSGKVAGAGLDVFSAEPPNDSPLVQHPLVIATPHLGASTQEAQRNVAVETAEQVVAVLKGEPPRYPVNAPPLSVEELTELKPHLELGACLGAFYAAVAADNPSAIEISYSGDVAEKDVSPITASILAALLTPAVEEPVNRINAGAIAKERGWLISERTTAAPQNFTNMTTMTVQTANGQRLVAGTVMRQEPHIVRVDDYWLDFVPRGHLLVSEHLEGPGIVGRVGMAVGEAGINISFIQLGRQERGGTGLMVLGLDDPVTTDLQEAMYRLPSIRYARSVSFV
jgi:D-3-phosphoglycerate dehydrogenase